MLKRRYELVISLSMVSLLLINCSIYRNNFACGDASGARCISLDQVDKMINNGTIKYFDEQGVSKQRIADRGIVSKDSVGNDIVDGGEELEETNEGLINQLDLYFNELES